MNTELVKKLNQIQVNLNAPKDAFNSFARYHYRSAESILQAVKPLLAETGLVLSISDSVEIIGDRVYIKATAKITDGNSSIETSAYAREPLNKKGADESQITGAASSYARKYALCGLFAIDDNKDADATNTHGKGEAAKAQEPLDLGKAIAALNSAENLATLERYHASAIARATSEQASQIEQVYQHRKADFLAAESE